MVKRIVAIVLIFILVLVAWLVLAGMTKSRSNQASRELAEEVAALWGDRQVQPAPTLTFMWATPDPATKKKHGKKAPQVWHEKPVLLESSAINVDFDLSHRKKGLLWYATYGLTFAGDYGYVHNEDVAGFLQITARFPSQRAIYDDFHFIVDGVENPQMTPVDVHDGKAVVEKIPVKPGQPVAFSVAYKSRGLDYWRYTFGENVNRVKSFDLAMTTNFRDIDFPDGSMSPTTKNETPNGWQLEWKFSNLISGFDIGMEMPKKLNPGPLAAQISFFAPLTLLYFFVWLFVITLLKKIDLHPMNYLFLSAAFFSFHLLLAYTVDHLDLLPAFLLSSAVSVVLVISYLRLAVGLRFAAVEAGLAQIVYLVLFSYAHFYRGWTGLIVTVGSILTLFLLMQLTGRINWAEKFAPRPPVQRPIVPPQPRP
ncbi:MAG: inner membrane CreD family protein [Candidatus Lernaella stagnicola]|nr:inner membrane CreD family protein [Candidatus Lernaella stagnicola]